jgi:hypothetical protein
MPFVASHDKPRLGKEKGLADDDLKVLLLKIPSWRGTSNGVEVLVLGGLVCNWCECKISLLGLVSFALRNEVAS